MDRHNSQGGSRPPSRQSQLSFGTRNTSPSRRISGQQESHEIDPFLDPFLLPSRPPTALTSDLSTLDSRQFDDIIADQTLENTRPSTANSVTSSKSKRERMAWVYKHQAGTEGLEEDDAMQAVFMEGGKEVWPCRYCQNKGRKKLYLISAGTVNIEKHLFKDNRVIEQSAAEKRAFDHQSSIQEAMKSAESNTHKRRKLGVEDPLEKELDPAILESLFTRFIATNNQALRLVECPEFRAFLTYLNDNINVWLPTSLSVGTRSSLSDELKYLLLMIRIYLLYHTRFEVVQWVMMLLLSIL